jgi:hypothetical protein
MAGHCLQLRTAQHVGCRVSSSSSCCGCGAAAAGVLHCCSAAAATAPGPAVAGIGAWLQAWHYCNLMLAVCCSAQPRLSTPQGVLRHLCISEVLATPAAHIPQNQVQPTTSDTVFHTTPCATLVTTVNGCCCVHSSISSSTSELLAHLQLEPKV